MDNGKDLTLGNVQDMISSTFSKMFPQETLGDSVVLEGSRETAKGFKYSYHLVYPSVVFPCNNRRMKTLAKVVGDLLTERHWVRAVDWAVYTKDRAFRMPLCHKLIDPSKTAMLWHCEPQDIHEGMLQSMIMNVDPYTQGIPDALSVASVRKTKPKQNNSKEDKSKQSTVAVKSTSVYSSTQVQWVRKLLQSFLCRKGGKGVVVVHVVDIDRHGGLHFRYQHGEMGREEPCLSHGPYSCVVHRNDNQFVSIDTDSFVVVTCPHGHKCSKKFFNFGRLVKNQKPVIQNLYKVWV